MRATALLVFVFVTPLVLADIDPLCFCAAKGSTQSVALNDDAATGQVCKQYYSYAESHFAQRQLTCKSTRLGPSNANTFAQQCQSAGKSSGTMGAVCCPKGNSGNSNGCQKVINNSQNQNQNQNNRNQNQNQNNRNQNQNPNQNQNNPNSRVNQNNLNSNQNKNNLNTNTNNQKPAPNTNQNNLNSNHNNQKPAPNSNANLNNQKAAPNPNSNPNQNSKHQTNQNPKPKNGHAAAVHKRTYRPGRPV